MFELHIIGLMHFFSGSITLLLGLAAFISTKGSRFHQLSGRSFIFFMGFLVISGLWMSVAREILFTVYLSTLTAYSFLTGWAAASYNVFGKIITKSSPLISLIIMVSAFVGGLKAAATESGVLNDLPPGAFYTIAGISALAFLLDLKYVFLNAPLASARLTRHVWRMGFSMFLSTAIFFFGNNYILPDFLRTPFYLSIPVLFVVLITVAYCLLINFYPKWISRKRL